MRRSACSSIVRSILRAYPPRMKASTITRTSCSNHYTLRTCRRGGGLLVQSGCCYYVQRIIGRGRSETLQEVSTFLGIGQPSAESLKAAASAPIRVLHGSNATFWGDKSVVNRHVAVSKVNEPEAYSLAHKGADGAGGTAAAEFLLWAA